MTYHVKYNFLVNVLLVLSVVYQLQSSNDQYYHDQRIKMQKPFRKALMTDENLFTLQLAFLAPRPISQESGVCLDVSMTMEEIIVTDNSSSSYFSNSDDCVYFTNNDSYYVCQSRFPVEFKLVYFPDNSSYSYWTYFGFELVVPPIHIEGLTNRLEKEPINHTLNTLDPSFYFLTNMFSNKGNKFRNIPEYYRYQLDMVVDGIEFNNLSRMQEDVASALYVTLS